MQKKGHGVKIKRKCSVKSFCEAKQSQKGFLVRNELKTHLLTDDFNPIE